MGTHHRSSPSSCGFAKIAFTFFLIIVHCDSKRKVSRGISAPHISLLQKGIVKGKTPASTGWPYILPLRRESVPIRRKGEVVSFKTSYSGELAIGSPAQDFRAVFDTGSAHVVLPAVECDSDSCLLHRRYNMTASTTSTAINVDGSVVLPGELTDQVSIGFGTGEVTGEFVKELVCLGASGIRTATTQNKSTTGWLSNPCVDMFVVMAVEMSNQPFKSFDFDGIVGLGLSSLALSSDFSFFDWVTTTSKLPLPYFGFYLTEGDDNAEEGSELSLGGYNPARTLNDISWAPVALPELGYWQLKILAIRVDGVTLDVCRDGTCRGIVDTGTSHWGIPSPFHHELDNLLLRPVSEDLEDCRLIEAPVVEIETSIVNLTLHVENYMRRMPLRDGVSVSSASGVSLHQEDAELQTTGSDGTRTLKKKPKKVDPEDNDTIAEGANVSRRVCRPRIMPVNLPAPLGPKLFLLGEPVLHRYYTVFDWIGQRIGFGLAATRRNLERLQREAATSAGPAGVSVMV